jgi:hydrophobe/amphiphile efflux-3 (HAE3) family protein
MIEILIRTVIRLRWLVIFITVLLTAYFAYHVKSLRFDSSAEGSIPKGDPSLRYFEEIREDFGNDQVALLVVVADGELGVFDPATLEKIGRLTDTISTFDGVDNVVSLTNTRIVSGSSGDRLTNELIVPQIPETTDSARAIRDRILGNPLFLKTLVSEDGRAAAINVFLADRPDSELIACGLDDKMNAIVQSEQNPEQLHYDGLIHTRMEINKAMQKDIKRFVPIAFVLILLVLYASFLTLRGMAIPALTVLFGVIWTFGLAGRLGVPISLTMTIIPPLLMAISCSLTIHIVSGYLDRSASTERPADVVRQTFAQLSLPLFISGLTTAIGFGTLIVSPIPNIQKVGALSSFGILSTMLISFTFVPAVLSLLGLPRRVSERESTDDFMSEVVDAILRFNIRHRKLLLIVAPIILALSLIGMSRIKVDTNFHSYFSRDSHIRRTAEAIGKDIAGASTFYLIASSDEPEAMRRVDVLQGIDSVQTFMEIQTPVDRATSIVNILKQFHQALRGDEPDSHVISSSQETIDEEILLSIDQEEPDVRAHYVVEDYSAMAIFARSQLVSTSDLADAIRSIEEYARDVLPADVDIRATGTTVILAESIRSIIKGQRDSLFLAFVLILIIVAILFRSLWLGVLQMIPNIIPIIMAFGIMGLAGIPLSLGTSLVAPICLGIAVDDTIHIMLRCREAIRSGLTREQAVISTMKDVGKPVIYTSIALCLGFLVLCFSEFGMLRSVGLLTGVTMLTCLLADLFLTVPLLLTFDFGKHIGKQSAQ